MINFIKKPRKLVTLVMGSSLFPLEIKVGITKVTPDFPFCIVCILCIACIHRISFVDYSFCISQIL